MILDFNDLPMCFCGEPFMFLLHVRSILDEMDKWSCRDIDAIKRPVTFHREADAYHKRLELLCGDEKTPQFWCWMYWLDAAGLTEHGGCVRSCWLTGKGEALLMVLRECDTEEKLRKVIDR